jgi:hypothetical protein
MNLLRARLVTQTRGRLKASPHHKIRPFVHANVMNVLAHKRKRLAINHSARLVRRSDRHRIGLSFPNNKLAMHRTPTLRAPRIFFIYGNDRNHHSISIQWRTQLDLKRLGNHSSARFAF